MSFHRSSTLKEVVNNICHSYPLTQQEFIAPTLCQGLWEALQRTVNEADMASFLMQVSAQYEKKG